MIMQPQQAIDQRRHWEQQDVMHLRLTQAAQQAEQEPISHVQDQIQHKKPRRTGVYWLG